MTRSLHKTPGPGTYSPEIVKYKKQRVKIGKERQRPHSAFIDLDNPGPGKYTLRPQVGIGLKYSMAARIKKKKRHYSPGPGRYEPKFTQTHESFGKTRIGSGKRGHFSAVTKLTPAPGTYNLKSTLAGP